MLVMQNIFFIDYFKQSFDKNNHLQISHRDKALIENVILYKSYNYDHLAKYLEVKYQEYGSSQKNINTFMFFLNGINDKKQNGDIDQKSIQYLLDAIEPQNICLKNTFQAFLTTNLVILSLCITKCYLKEFFHNKDLSSSEINILLATSSMYILGKIASYPIEFVIDRLNVSFIENALDKTYNSFFGYEDLYQQIIGHNNEF
jgi:hypothetical protein